MKLKDRWIQDLRTKLNDLDKQHEADIKELQKRYDEQKIELLKKLVHVRKMEEN